MNIFFIGPTQSTFVKNDIKVLEKKHHLFIDNSSFGRGIRGLFNLTMLSIRSFFKILRSDAIFCWFADFATFFPTLLGKLLGKKVYVIAGGFDARYIPELNYGARARKWRWFCVEYTFNNATKIFPVSISTEQSLFELTNGKNAPTEVIYNGVNVEEFLGASTGINTERTSMVLTISQADTKLESDLKGIDYFIDIAKEMPDTEFVIAGLRATALDIARNQAGSAANIKIIPGPLDLYEDLIPLYKSAATYCQLSRDETFGLAVVEAMLCGCMPIVSGAGGLSEVIISEDYISTDKERTKQLMQQSFTLSEADRQRFTEHAKKFEISLREEQLLKAIEG
jgi:glycosyltransferase involved in cell wall biosynthesis